MPKDIRKDAYKELRDTHPWLHWAYYIRRRMFAKNGVPYDKMPTPERMELWATMTPDCEQCGLPYRLPSKQGPHPQARTILSAYQQATGSYEFTMICASCAGQIVGRPRKYQR